ncbi:MAG: hypothetical protein R3A44_28725 [Caldilineaceae bacterium]
MLRDLVLCVTTILNRFTQHATKHPGRQKIAGSTATHVVNTAE